MITFFSITLRMFLFFLLCFQFQSTNAGNESLSKQKHKARLVICDFLTMLSSCDKKDKIFFRDQPVGNLSNFHFFKELYWRSADSCHVIERNSVLLQVCSECFSGKCWIFSTERISRDFNLRKTCKKITHSNFTENLKFLKSQFSKSGIKLTSWAELSKYLISMFLKLH